MYLRDLSLLNFKNYELAEISFDEKVNCLVGINGSGKTNLLDAIYYLAFSKSFFSSSDTQNIFPTQSFFSLQGHFVNGEEKDQKIQCSLKKGHKKVLKCNNKNYERYADHIGQIPLVMVSPIDILLIIEGSELRRKWIDGIISQFDKSYLEHLIAYNKALQQRNSQLKQMNALSGDAIESLELWNDHLIEKGQYIFEQRETIMNEISTFFNAYYKDICDGSESVNIHYSSHLQSDKSFEEQLTNSVKKDFRLQYTSIGIHKDDIEFTIDQRQVKKFASQGQQKSVLMSLRLAQARLIAEKKGSKPLMLLDDIYDKLDAERMSRFLEILKSKDFGQLFITDTNLVHMKSLLASSGMTGKFFEVKKGNVNEVSLAQSEVNTLN